jgi:Methyltransferase domain
MSSAAVAAPPCKICSTDSRPFAVGRVLGKYDVRYFQCPRCRFVQTERPYWLAEAYSTALVAADVGAVQRNIELAATTQAVLQQFFDAGGRFLDYGAGYGVFVRMMRDRGFDFRWQDKYASNLLSIGFEAAPGDDGFELVTAFEVLEHLEHPVEEVGEMLRRGRALLCSTQLLPPGSPKPGEWWYYAPSGGQHIALYTREALAELARRFGRHLVSNGSSLHLFSERPVSERLFRAVLRGRVTRLLNRLRRRPSLIPADFAAITGERLG